MTIKNRPIISEDDMRFYYCVDYGGHLFAFQNEDDAFKAFKALNNAHGISSYYDFTSADGKTSGMLHNVIKECSSSLQKRKAMPSDHIEACYMIRKEAKCDEPGCWKQEELNEDGSIPDGWQEADDKHYCPVHSIK